MPNLNSTIDIDYKKFLRWWSRELGFLVPENIKQWVIDRTGYLIISPENGSWSLSYLEQGETISLSKLERNDQGFAQFKDLLASDEKFAKASIIVRIAEQNGLAKELVLPAAAKENLQQVVAYEFDRYTPFKLEQAYFAVKAIAGDNEAGQIKVMLTLTLREYLDSLCEDLKVVGVAPTVVDYQGFANDLHDMYAAYNLLPETLRQKKPNTPRLIHTGLLATAVTLLLATLALPVALQYQTVAALTDKIKVIEKDAKKIKTLQQDVDTVINETQKLLDEKRARPPMVRLLNELSRLIKDDTSLTYMQYSDGHLQIQGESPAASSLIAVLEESDLFNNARFVSPVTQNTVTKLERFQITVDVTQVGGVKNENP